MIAINSRGDFCHGNGGSYFNINNVAIMPGASFGWIDDDTAACANGADTGLPPAPRGEWIASQYHVPTKTLTRLSAPPTGANHGFAGGGHAAWWWGNGGGSFSTTGWNGPNTGLLGMGPDGAIAYKPDYQSNGPTMVRELDGAEWLLTPNHAYDLQLLGQRRALFNDSVLGFTVVGIPVPQRLPGANWFPHAFQLDDVWWFGCQNEHAGVVAHPFADPAHGWIVVPTGDAWPAFRALDRYTLCCVWSNGLAEQAGQLTARRFDLRVDPLVAIGRPAAPIPPPVPPPPPPSGTVAIGSWGPATGQAPLTVAAAATWTGDVARIQWLRAREGDPTWVLDSVPRDPRVDPDHHMTFGAGRYVIGVRGLAADGTMLDQTGRSRVVEVTDVPPTPIPNPPFHVDRFWFGPNIGSPILALFEHPEQWETARASMGAFCLVIQHLLSIGPIGATTYDALLAIDAFRTLRAWGVAFALEAGAIKPEDWHGEQNQQGLRTAVERLTAAGGELSYLTMDEPLTSAKQKPGGQPLEETADAVAAYIALGESFGAKVGWAEAWPEIDLDTMRRFLILLDERGRLPHYWHLDIDSRRAAGNRQSVETFLRDAHTIASDYAMPVGVYLAGYPALTDDVYCAQTLQWAQEVRTLQPRLARVLVQSWAERARDTEHGPQDLPRNLPDSDPNTLTALFASIVRLFS